jgi:glycosyltransferase involved in cell wall biosynthesis
MKVAYDISVLGQGYTNPKARTGIYRVVESLLHEIIAQKQIDILPVSLTYKDAIWNDLSSELYWKENLLDSGIKYIPSYSSPIPNLVFQKAIKIQHYLLSQIAPQANILYKPSLAISLLFRQLGYLNQRKLLSLANADVFHSPFYAFPKLEAIQHTAKVLTVYDLIPILYKEKFTVSIYDNFLNSINSINPNKDYIAAISQNTKNDLCNHLAIEPERVFVTPLAAGKTFYPVQDSSAIQAALSQYAIPVAPYFLSLCTLEPRKNLAFLVASFAALIEENPSLEVNLVLVGAVGWKNQALFTSLDHYSHLKHRVILAGYIPDSDLSSIYSGALAFVYPSIYEGFGLPPLEAMQCGIPVITSNTSSLPEVVGDAGIMIDPKDEDALCQAMLDIINNQTLRTELSRKGLERAKQFSWAKCAEQTVNVYRIAAKNLA